MNGATADTTGQAGAPPRAPRHRPEFIQALGTEFAGRMAVLLTGAQWAEMRERNATPAYAGSVCASHDYLDANDVMDAAFRSVMDRDADGASEADAALWSAAWAYAKATHLTASGNAFPTLGLTFTMPGAPDAPAMAEA